MNSSGNGNSRVNRAAAGSYGNRGRSAARPAVKRPSGRDGSHQKENSSGSVPLKERKPKKKHRRVWLVIKIIFLLLLLAILAALGIFYVKYGNTLLKWQSEAKAMVADSSEEDFKASEASFIYDSRGKLMAKLKGEKDSYYLTFDEIPQYVKDAFIVTEDRDFYEHQGYDIKALTSAMLSLVKNKMKGEDASRGASTITQQLARNVFTDYLDYTDKSYSRKVREIFVATEMEKKYSKDQILEFYINNAYFANGYYGIEAAARGYFSRSVSDLGLAEVAFICAIPNRPQSYDPLEHFDNTISRKNRILDQMLAEKSISAAEYSDAYYQDIVMKPAEEIKTQNYLTTYAITCATKALMQKQGFEFRYDFASDADRDAYDKEYDQMYDECNKALHTSGYNIYTTLSKKIQKKLQTAVNQQLAVFTEKKKGTYTLQGAATCINNENGRVVAIVGGRKQKSTSGYTLNRGFQAYRQPGSCFKPIAVYTPQLERDYTADTIVDDTFFEGGPRNSDGNYSGKIPLRTAVEKSKNVIAWKLFEELTPEVGLKYITNMNFSKIVDDDRVPAAALGGLTNGVSTVEMASAYATLANDGKFRNPTCIKKITDYDGNVVVNMNKLVKQKQVYQAEAAERMTDILEGVLVRGTGAGKQLSNMACAGKTGTTSDKKDGWFCGFTPYYSTAVWVGYDTPRELSNLYGNTYPLYIWHQFMEDLHDGMAYKEFEYDYKDTGEDTNYTTSVEEETEEITEPEETVDPSAVEPDTDETVDDPSDADDGEGDTGKDKNTGDGQSQDSKPAATKKPQANNNSGGGNNEGGGGNSGNTDAGDSEYEDVGEETTIEEVN